MIPHRNQVVTIAEAPIIQYSSGHSRARAAGSAGAFVGLVGFHAEQGKDAAFDEACKAANIAVIEIRHQRPGGSEVKRHWSFGESLAFYPLTSGPVAGTVAASLANGNARRTSEAGIAVRWGETERSKLAVRGILMVLLGVGYVGVVQLSVRSRMTDALLGALVDHTRVAELADGLVNRQQHPDPVGLWELALPLGPGAEQSWGKVDSVDVVPLASQHPAEVERDYIRTIYLANSSPARAALIAAWAATVNWAAEYAAGRVGDELAAPALPTDEAPTPEASEESGLFDEPPAPPARRTTLADVETGAAVAGSRRRR